MATIHQLPAAVGKPLMLCLVLIGLSACAASTPQIEGTGSAAVTEQQAVNAGDAGAAQPADSAAFRTTSSVSKEDAAAVIGYIFSRLDCDLEGTVEVSEVDDHFAQVWTPLDIDWSRSLSPKEYSLTHVAKTEASARTLYEHADRNGDGRIGYTEFRLHLQELVAVLDANDDREVSRAEVMLAIADTAESPAPDAQ